jgi:hypothetical protein
MGMVFLVVSAGARRMTSRRRHVQMEVLRSGNALDGRGHSVQQPLYDDEDVIGGLKVPLKSGSSLSLGWNLMSGQGIHDIAAGPDGWLPGGRGTNFAFLPFLSYNQKNPCKRYGPGGWLQLRFGGHDRVGDVLRSEHLV